MDVMIVEGFGDDLPKTYTLGKEETVGQLRQQFAAKFKVSESQIEITTGTAILTNDNALISNYVKKGETIDIMPRAKAGTWALLEMS